MCLTCRGNGFYVPDLPLGDPAFGRAKRCRQCQPDYAAHCGLTTEELTYTVDTIEGKNEIAVTLRHLVRTICDQPTGWLTLYGDSGSAKTLAIQAIIATLVRNGAIARFAHAHQVEQAWLADRDDDKSNAVFFLNAPILALDELDKTNLKNDWVRQQFQYLLDHRYRQAVAGNQLTLITLQFAPEKTLPNDMVSRMNDGRFYRPWPYAKNALTVNRWGQTALPGLLHVQGPDARPYVAPSFAKAQKKVSRGVQGQ